MNWFWMACCSVQFLSQAIQRQEIEQRYGLKADSTSKNQVRAFCCINCDLLQQDKEIVSREAERKALVLEQPAPVSTMAYGGDEKDNKESIKM